MCANRVQISNQLTMEKKFAKSGKQFEMSIYLDTRRTKADEYYPLKIKVYTPKPKKRKYYSVGIDMNKETYEKVFLSVKPRKAEKEIRIQVESLLHKYIEVANRLDNFTFESFENLLFKPEGDVKDVFYLYQQKIKTLELEKREATKHTYEASVKSIKKFLKANRKRDPKHLFVQDITVEWLKNFEKWMLEKGNSKTTVGYYLRTLRHIFNTIKTDHYPFGKNGYVIPKGTNKKKALDKHQLKLLFEGKPENQFQQRAKDFWFFSYLCKGMNMKDILYLKWKNVNGDFLEFVREKTKDTTDEQIVIRVPLMEHSKKVIKVYGVTSGDREEYVFPILHKEMAEGEKLKAKQNFTRLVNQHMKRYAEKLGIKENVSTYTARHSFATMAIRNNASIEYVGESLGHADIKTTKAYIKSFLDDESDKKMIGNLVDFG
ncbi:site-specific recombinase XerD [Echinicola vietnamensis DSM 17526]|uniref:Site-specific recombinase XerD n=2 Tax=Echinicola TaxID=390846 RepID=L0FY96_ECHVK|nr:site-specific recombinase XerD [Echinicola vietnamensis DSM 17526]